MAPAAVWAALAAAAGAAVTVVGEQKAVFTNAMVCSKYNHNWCMGLHETTKDRVKMFDRAQGDVDESRLRWNVTMDPNDGMALRIVFAASGRCVENTQNNRLETKACRDGQLTYGLASTVADNSLHNPKFHIKGLDLQCVWLNKHDEAQLAVEGTFLVGRHCEAHGNQHDDEGIWLLLGYTKTLPTRSPSTSPSGRPSASPTTPSPTESPTLKQPTRAPSPSPSASPTVQGKFSAELVLLAHSSAVTGEMLGLGVSTGDTELIPVQGEDVQLKSFSRLSSKSDLAIKKMLWTMTTDGHLHPNAPELIVFLDGGAFPNNPTTIHGSDLLILAREETHKKDDRKIVWEMAHQGDAGYFKLRLRNVNKDGARYCMTVSRCEAYHADPPSNGTRCLKRESRPACEDNGKLCDLQPGAYMKIMQCNPLHDTEQLFVIRDADLHSESPTASPVRQPTTASPVRQPTRTETTKTPAPTQQGTDSKSTQKPTPAGRVENPAPPSNTSREGIKELTIALVFLLLATCFLILFLVFAARRKSKRRKRDQAWQLQDETSDIGDDDDDQEFFNSFETDGLYSQPSQDLTRGSGAELEPRNGDNSLGLSERMISNRNKRNSSMSFDPHVTHFEQEQGFVARV